MRRLETDRISVFEIRQGNYRTLTRFNDHIECVVEPFTGRGKELVQQLASFPQFVSNKSLGVCLSRQMSPFESTLIKSSRTRA